MPRIDIHTTLGFCPKPRKHEMLVITRGATASMSFNLFDKVYDFENIEQFTYMFKQGKKLLAYQMVEYFALTADTVAQVGKNYYNRIDINLPESSGYKFELASIAAGAAIPANTLYEEHELLDGEINENWQMNSHFHYYHGDSYSYINFMMSAEETKQFAVTAPDYNVKCEAAIRLDTDAMVGMHNMDAVIIAPQHPIAVVDSLYSKISQASGGSYAQTAICSENTYCSENLVCDD